MEKPLPIQSILTSTKQYEAYEEAILIKCKWINEYH
jgi:hypothetical protein